MRGQPKKTSPVKKEWQVGRGNDSRSRRPRTALAPARTGADGAVGLNLRRGPGAYALLLRADGQLTRAGQHYYSHLGLRPPARLRLQPASSARSNDYICTTEKKLVRFVQRGEHRLTKLGKGFFRDKYYEYLVRAGDHPGQTAQRTRCTSGWPTPPSSCPFCARTDGVEPVDGVLPDRGFVEAAATQGSPASICCVRGPGWYPKFRWPRCWTWAFATGTTSCWASPQTRRRCGARWSAWTPRGPKKARSTWPSSA